jgi:hypothetical protein
MGLGSHALPLGAGINGGVSVGSIDTDTSVDFEDIVNVLQGAVLQRLEATSGQNGVFGSVAGDEKLTTYAHGKLASGFAAIWTRENTREGLFEAMQKKATYATTGTRMTVRIFGRWDYGVDDVFFRADAVSIGYDKGVPMGATSRRRFR